MNPITEKLNEYGIHALLGKGRIKMQTDFISFYGDVKAGTGEDMRLMSLIDYSINLQIVDVAAFKQKMKIPAFYEQMDDLLFTKLSFGTDDDDEKLGVYLVDRRLFLQKEMKTSIQENIKFYQKANKEFALKHAFEPEKAIKQLMVAQVELAFSFVRDPFVATGLAKLQKELEQAEKEFIHQLKTKQVIELNE